MAPATNTLSTMVREAGYQLIRCEQLRANRWLIIAESPEGRVLILAQQRPTISAADVQDLAEQLRLSRITLGYLLAMGGRFTPEAQRTAAELRQPQIVLCGSIPPAGQPLRVSSAFGAA